MSYLALARKYRPQTFSAVAAQNFVTTTLQNAISMGRVSHAYLFTGPRGVGKTSTARIFAKALNCLSPDGANPCGKCENCLDIAAGTAIDVIEIDGASNRGVDEIRSLRESVKFVPVRSRYKIYIVDEVHMLTKEAFNALLKTLEEPPEFVKFIFATTDNHKLPPTILSRCQRYEFTKIPYDEMMGSIISILNAENIPYEEDALNLVIRNSEGCMRDALSILDQVIAYTDGNVDFKNTSFLTGVSDKYLSDEVFEILLREKPDKIPEIVSRIDEKGCDYKFMAECLVEHTRNMLFYVTTGDMPSKEYTSLEKEFYGNLKKYGSDRRLYALFQIFQKLLNDLKYFDFPKYIFEFALFKAASISQIIPVEAIGNVAINREIPKDVPLVKSEKIVIKKDAVPIKEIVKDKVTVQEDIKPPVTAPADTSVTSSGLWDKALNLITKEGGPFGCNIQNGYLVSSTPEKIVIGFHKDRRFYYEFYNKSDRKSRIQDILNKLASPAPRFEIVLEEDDNSKKKAPAEQLIQAESYRDRQLKKAARDNPVVKTVIEQMDAEIESITILGNKSDKE